jgi:hypothetical protein
LAGGLVWKSDIFLVLPKESISLNILIKSIADLICSGKLGSAALDLTSKEATISDKFCSKVEYKAILSLDYSSIRAVIHVTISFI